MKNNFGISKINISRIISVTGGAPRFLKNKFIISAARFYDSRISDFWWFLHFRKFHSKRCSAISISKCSFIMVLNDKKVVSDAKCNSPSNYFSHFLTFGTSMWFWVLRIYFGLSAASKLILISSFLAGAFWISNNTFMCCSQTSFGHLFIYYLLQL